MKWIEKRFGSVTALSGVDFDLKRGEIHALVGVNGAGKSTLIKILAGIHKADSGTIRIDGEARSISSPSDAIAAGVGSVQQHPELVGDYRGYENIFLGQEASRKGLFSRINRRAMRQQAQSLLERLPVDIDLDLPVDALTSVEKEIIAVLHSLKQGNVKILILDEPTSILTLVEKEQLFKMMNVLRGSGVSIIYITHRLEEVFEIADRFTVFRGGARIATMTCEQAKSEGVSIPRLMLQGEMRDMFPHKAASASAQPVALAVADLALPPAFEKLSFSARPGEILGFFGLVGSGIDELAKTLFGALRPATGEIRLHGRKIALGHPRAALKQGIFLVPGDRTTEGLVLADSVIFNTTLANLSKASTWGGLLRFHRNRKTVTNLAKQTDLTPPALSRPASEFSGGNQQKIVIAKGLFSDGTVFVFVEPTVGVDVGARAKIYRLMRILSERAAVIVMSSDCDEVFGLSDQVSALYRGRMVFEPSCQVNRDQLLTGGIMGVAP